MSITLAPEFEEALQKGLQDGIEQSFEPIIDEAVERLRKELRGRVSHIALTLLREYEMFRDGQNVIIRVKDEALK